MFLNTVLQGEALAILRSLPDNSVDAVITDPPYSSGGTFRADRMPAPTTKYLGGDKVYAEFPGDNRDQRSFALWMTLWLTECWRVTKPGGVVAIFTDWRQMPTVSDVLQGGGYSWRGVAAWDKTEAARPQKGQFRNQCEYIVWGSKGRMNPAANPVCLPGVFRLCLKHREKQHPTGKPIELMRQIVQLCPSGGLVLDPFAGSGSTLLAAAQEGRQFLGIELTEHYHQVSQERLAEYLNPVPQPA